jgi:DNA-binding transcriptional LysR family regulator
MAKVDLNHIAMFVRVVEDESFSAAAKALGLPKSSVSRSVARLEEDLGVRLLHRTTRKLSLTEAGRAFFDRVRDPMVGLGEAMNEAEDMGVEPRGAVRLTAPVDLGALLLPDVIARFAQRYPQIRVELSLTARVVDLVEEGFDLAVRAARLPDSTLVARKLGDSPLGVFASPTYLRRRGRPRAVADLAAHDCILFRARGGKSTWSLLGPDGVEPVDVRGSVSADDMTFVLRAVASCMGLGLLPLFFQSTCAERDKIVRVLPDHAIDSGSIYVVTPTARHEPARVALFREFLVTSLKAVKWTG